MRFRVETKSRSLHLPSRAGEPISLVLSSVTRGDQDEGGDAVPNMKLKINEEHDLGTRSSGYELTWCQSDGVHSMKE